MAKERWQKAWEFFVGEFTGEGPIYPKNRWGGYSRKSFRRKRQESERLFWAMIGVLESFGIQTLKHKDLGKSKDVKGEEFTVAGSWNATGLKNPTVNLTYESTRVLAHEFTHAMDFLKGDSFLRANREFVACAGEHLLICYYLGLCSPTHPVDYAKRQGAMIGHLKRLEGYTHQLFGEMIVLIDEHGGK